MNERDEELLRFYRAYRIEDQLGFYGRRRDLLERASTQASVVSATLLGFGTALAALAGGGVGPVWLWTVLATVLPAAVTALTAYGTLFAFDQQSKIYGDTVRAVRAAARGDTKDPAQTQTPADVVARVEGAFRVEHAQWGQLTAQIELPHTSEG